jgi:hypothetical protein
MSALPPKADIGTQSRNVRYVPKAHIAAKIELEAANGEGEAEALRFLAIPVGADEQEFAAR